MRWTPESATKAAHQAGFAGTCWAMGPEELALLLNRAAAPMAALCACGDRCTDDGAVCVDCAQEVECNAVKLPTTPEEVVAFIGSNYNSMRTHNEDGIPLAADMVRYDLTVHDLLSAFDDQAIAMESASPDFERLRQVCASQEAQICELREQLRIAGEALGGRQAAVPRHGGARKPKCDPVFETNRRIVEEHRAEIHARREGGEKPTQTAEWLRQFGFVGTGGTLNGFVPWR